MAGSITIRKPQLRLSDPAESQRPLTFYTQIVRRHWVTIGLVSTALTALVVLACALAGQSTASASSAAGKAMRARRIPVGLHPQRPAPNLTGAVYAAG